MEKPERPLTVAGLLDKRRDLAAKLKAIHADLNATAASIEAIDAVLRLFNAQADLATFTPKRFPSPHWAGKGELSRLVFQVLHETGAPVNSSMIADRFCDARGIPLDSPERKAVRERTSCSLSDMRRRGLLVEAEPSGRLKAWRLPD